MNELPRKIITVTSSLNEISMEQLGNRVAVREGEALLWPLPTFFPACFLTDI
jgi:hypothetical protein